MALRRSDQVVVGLWFLLGAVLVWAGISELRTWSTVNSAVVVSLLLAAFCVFTAITIAKSKPSARWLGESAGRFLSFTHWL